MALILGVLKDFQTGAPIGVTLRSVSAYGSIGGETSRSGFGFSARHFLLVAILVCFGATLIPSQADAWVDIDSPGTYTNDNTPLIAGDAEINFYVGVYTKVGCEEIPGTGGVCLPYFYVLPSVGYTDVLFDLNKADPPANYWCPDICANYVEDEYITTPTPSLPDLFAYSAPYSYNAPQIADGRWRLRITHYGEDAPSPTLDKIFYVDTRAPSNTQITVKPPLFSNDTTPTFDWTADDPAPSSGLEFECDLDGAGWVDCPADKTFNTPEGNHTLSVRATDRAGNVDPTPATYSWMVDTTPPNAVIGGIAPKQRFLLHANIPATASCDDPISGGVRSGLAPSGVASSTSPPECSATNTDNETLGPHEFRITTSDRAGNQTITRLAYVIDPPAYYDLVDGDNPIAYYRFDEQLGSDQMLDSLAQPPRRHLPERDRPEARRRHRLRAAPASAEGLRAGEPAREQGGVLPRP